MEDLRRAGASVFEDVLYHGVRVRCVYSRVLCECSDVCPCVSPRVCEICVAVRWSRVCVSPFPPVIAVACCALCCKRPSRVFVCVSVLIILAPGRL